VGNGEVGALVTIVGVPVGAAIEFFLSVVGPKVCRVINWGVGWRVGLLVLVGLEVLGGVRKLVGGRVFEPCDGCRVGILVLVGLEVLGGVGYPVGGRVFEPCDGCRVGFPVLVDL
jgi:hypothetical protein